MFTRFRTASAEYLMNWSGGVPLNSPGEDFLTLLASSYQDSMRVSRMALLKSARTLLKFTTDARHLLAYRYFCSYHPRGGDKSHKCYNGGITGFKIDGRAHTLWVGEGECYLERKVASPHGGRRLSERIDVRERKTIQTDDWGIIRILRREREFSLPAELAKCVSFLASVADAKITLYSFDKPPTVGDLVDRFADGEDDWVLEEIARDSAHWRSELLAALKLKSFAYHRETIIRLLFLSFRDAKTRTAVVESINALPKKYRPELLAFVADLEK